MAKQGVRYTPEEEENILRFTRPRNPISQWLIFGLTVNHMMSQRMQ